MRLLPVFVLLAVTIATVANAEPRDWQAEGWMTDFSKTEIDLTEIMSGGPSRDEIPPIDNPKFVAVKQSHLLGREPVISVAVGTDVRAYPLSVLIWHEIVNDTIGGVPVAVTYCPLCDSAIVFDRTIDERVLRFGTTGKLRYSDLVMWDDATESWWQQFLGRAIVGDYLGKELKVLPSRVESFARFKSKNPNGRVLVPRNENRRAYGSNPYVGYDQAGWPFLYRGEVPEGVFPLARVVRVGNAAWALDLVRSRKSIDIGEGIVIAWTFGQASALSNHTIADGEEIGNVTVIQSGKDVIYDVPFLFAFHAFFPEAPIYVNCETGGHKPKPPVVCFK